MVEQYTGEERRVPLAEGQLGRRRLDWHCAEHPLIQESARDHRNVVCGKITVMQAEVKKMVTWKIFAFFTTFAVAVVGAGFGFFSMHIDRLSDRHYSAMTEIQESLHSIRSAQTVMGLQIDAVKARQDVLRDAHMLDMQQGGKR